MIFKKFKIHILVAPLAALWCMAAALFAGAAPARAAVYFSQLDSSGGMVDAGTVIRMGQFTGAANVANPEYIGEYFSRDGGGYYISDVEQCDDPNYSTGCGLVSVGFNSLAAGTPATTVLAADNGNNGGSPFTLIPGKYYELVWGRISSSQTKANPAGDAFFAFGDDRNEVAATLNDAISRTLGVSPLAQYDADTGAPIAAGAVIANRAVSLAATPEFNVSSSTAASSTASPVPLQAQFELEPFGTPFTGVPTATSDPVPTGQTASTTAAGITDAPYAWQARALDPATGIASPWQTFGAAAMPAFTVRSAPLPQGVLAEQTDGGVSANPNATAFAQGFVAAASGTLASLDAQAGGIYTGCFIGPGGPINMQAFLYDAGSPGGANDINVIATSGVVGAVAGAQVHFDFISHPILLAEHAYTWVIRASAPCNSYATGNLVGAGANTAGGLAYAQFSDNNWQAGPSRDVPANYYFVVNAAPVAPAVPPPPPPPAPPAHEPVIMVPGIMGSALDKTSDGTELWPDVRDMLISPNDGYLDQLMLDANGAQIPENGMDASSVIEEVFGQTFYKNLLDVFRNGGYMEGRDLFTVPYDWRVRIESSTAALAAVVARAASSSPTGRVNIVAHSMGGLLVKQYLAGLAAGGAGESSTAASSVVDRLVLAGVPQLGAPQAFKILNYGDNMGFQFPVIGTNLLDPQEVKKIVQNMPAAYELLPGARYTQVAGGYVQDFRSGGGNQVWGFGQTNAFMAGDGRNAGLLDSAAAFHAPIDAEPVNAPDVYNIVGCLNPTIMGYDLYDGGVVDVTRGAGDGTVPVTSAMDLANGFHNYFVLGDETGIDHTGLIRDARPLALIKSIVDGADVGTGAASGTIAVPDGISTSTADCLTPRPQSVHNETTLEFSSHSPVALNVYDAQDRHTGPAEIGIPGSRYETIGDNTFILVPAGGAYNVVARGIASGTMELKVKGYIGSTLDRSASYLSVPVRSAGMEAELNFSDWSGDMRLRLDEDGDGTFETSTLPGAAASGTPAADMAPPAIAITATSTGIGVAVSDAGSGVALAQTYVDGALMLGTGTADAIDFSSLAAGTHTLSVFAYDEAGNPAAASTTFLVPTSAPVTATSTIGDIERCFRLGWFGKQSAENDLIAKVRGIVRFQKDIRTVRTRLPNGRIINQNIQTTVQAIDRAAARSLLKDLGALHDRRGIKDAGYAILKMDLERLAQ